MEANREKSVNNEGPEVKLKGKALLIYDLKQRKLIPTKILFFVVLSSKFLILFGVNYIIVTWREWYRGRQLLFAESAESKKKQVNNSIL